jgi:adenine phosphoribosyltransferase
MTSCSPNLSLSEIPVEAIRTAVRDIPDYPKPGILFKDITTVLRQPELFRSVIDYFTLVARDQDIQYVVGIESRGFIFGAPLADRIGAGFVPVRKRGKLPGSVAQYEYDLEYGTDCIEIHDDAIEPGARVLLVDDLLATGGTAEAAAQLIRKVGGELIGAAFLIELSFLPGREKLASLPRVDALIQY